jgi:hypothetical protein
LPLNPERKTLSQERQQEIADLLRSGKTCNEIQEQTGVFRETIRKIGMRKGIPIPPSVRVLPELSRGIIDKSGYILLRVSARGPYGNLIRCLGENRTMGYALLHRIRMQDHLGRKLTDEEVVHHVDGDLYNNSIANLDLFATNGDHLAETLKARCPKWTEDGLRRIHEGASKPRGPRARSGIRPSAPPAAANPEASKNDGPA